MRDAVEIARAIIEGPMFDGAIIFKKVLLLVKGFHDLLEDRDGFPLIELEAPDHGTTRLIFASDLYDDLCPSMNVRSHLEDMKEVHQSADGGKRDDEGT